MDRREEALGERLERRGVTLLTPSPRSAPESPRMPPATASRARRARTAAEKVYIPLTGELPTRRSPLSNGGSAPQRNDEGEQ